MLKKWSHGEEKKSEPDTSLKLLTVLNEDLDEADLKAVLLECLRDAPQDQDDDPKNVSACLLAGVKDAPPYLCVSCL